MANSTIFDDVFRTMLEKMPQLIIPLINEVFGTDYPGDISIVQRRNEHYTRNGAIITDSHLFIADKIYHIECQSTSDSTMIIRMIEYDFAAALEFAEKENGKYRIYFPQSCVLYLRGKNGPDFLEMELVMPEGQSMNYRVPVVRVERYTSDMIFQKKLLFLLPFYIIRYEKQVKEIDEDDAIFQGLMEEYRVIEEKLEKELLDEGKEKQYRDLIELIDRIADYIFKESSRVKKGIGEIMGGQVLELESDKMIKRAQIDIADRMLDAGKYGLGEISEMSGLPLDTVRELWEKKNGYEHSCGQALELESERLYREGREEGRAAGMVEKTVDFVTQLLRDGKYNATEISQIFGVPMEQIMELKKEKNL